MVAVAQLVERRIVIPVVAGSIPVGHPISKLSLWFFSSIHAIRILLLVRCSVVLGLSISLSS